MTRLGRLCLCSLGLVFLFGCTLKMEAFQAEPLRWDSFQHDGGQRDYAFYIPATLANQPAPLVVLLHGGGGSAETTWRRDYGQTWRQLADKDGFVLLLPQGRSDLSAPDSHHWNDCRTGIISPDVATRLNDSDFIWQAIQRVGQRVNLDAGRLYATGASNGGMMTFRLAFELGDSLAAVAPIIANLPDPSECGAPVAKIPVLIMNGTADPLIPHEGGCVANESCRRGKVRSTEETVTFWVDFNGAEATPRVKSMPNIVMSDQSTVSVYTYPNSTNGAEVVLYLIEGGGHTVPGPEPDTLAKRLAVGPKNQDINGPEEVWAFFSRHAR